MWRNVELKKRPFLLTIFVVFRAFYYGKLTEVFASFNSLPLLTILIGGLWIIGLDWKLLLLIPLSVLCQLFINFIIARCVQTLQVFREMQDLFNKHSQRTFSIISKEEYFDSLFANHPSRNDKKEEDFLKSMLPESEYYLGDYIRLVLIEQEKTSAVGVFSSFVGDDAAWIFLTTPPSKMSPSQHFSVLHEIGHADSFNGLIGNPMKANKYHLLAALPIILLLVDWDITTATLILSLFTILFFLHKTDFSFYINNVRFYREVLADSYALWRCPKEWFDKWNDKSIERIASAISRDEIATSQISNLNLAPNLTSEQQKFRYDNLVNNIRRIKKREALSLADDTTDPKEKNRLRLRLILTGLFSGLLIMTGLQFAELSLLRIIALIVITLVLFIATSLARSLELAATRYLDIKCGLEPEIPFNGIRNLESLLIILRSAYGPDFEPQMLRVREKIEQYKDKYVDKNFTPPDVTGTFLPARQIALYSNKDTFESLIINRGDKIDYNVSHLEYYSQNHSIVVVMSDGRRLDLGTTLLGGLRPYFLRATEITLVQTVNENDELEEVTVPLRQVA